MAGHAARAAGVSIDLPLWDPASSIPTLIGSLLSVFATLSVILLWIFAGGKKRQDFRYALILNLTVAEFLNSLNNSVSGIYAVAGRKPLSTGLACEVNGWAGQFSVQAIDFSILAITLVTLLTIRLCSFVIYASTATRAFICLSIWVIPLCTSVYAWSKNYYGPVSGNWCWIEKQFTRQRYFLNHGWRFAIFLITLCTYAFVFIYMSHRLKPQNLSNISSSIPDDLNYDKIQPVQDTAVLAGCGSTPRLSIENEAERDMWSSHDVKRYRHRSSFSFSRSLRLDTTPGNISNPTAFATVASPDGSSPIETFDLVDLKKPSPSTAGVSPYPTQRPKASRSDREIWKMMFLNMYPVTYLILWIPGIANRIAEAMGYDIRALVIMQSSTQFIGLVNAGVYLYKEHWRNRI